MNFKDSTICYLFDCTEEERLEYLKQNEKIGDIVYSDNLFDVLYNLQQGKYVITTYTSFISHTCDYAKQLGIKTVGIFFNSEKIKNYGFDRIYYHNGGVKVA